VNDPYDFAALVARDRQTVLIRWRDTARMLKTLRRSHQQLDGLVRKMIEENANPQSENGVRLQRREFGRICGCNSSEKRPDETIHL
jgi:hypothetical protein